MNNVTTIQVDKSVLESLQSIKQYPRQPYNELIFFLVKLFKTVKKSNQYDEFLHKIQQPKMKELWNNKEDEVWDSV